MVDRQLYRDIMRLIVHVAGQNSPKAHTLREMARKQFKANKDVTDPSAIEEMKGQAEQVLSSYLLYEQAVRDPRMAAAREKMHEETTRTFREDEHGRTFVVEKRQRVRAMDDGKEENLDEFGDIPSPRSVQENERTER